MMDNIKRAKLLNFKLLTFVVLVVEENFFLGCGAKLPQSVICYPEDPSTGHYTVR